MKCNMNCKYSENLRKKYGKNADPRIIDIVENYDRYKIGLDETFKFGCKMCGKCCINREDIILNPKDLYNIAKELGKTIIEVVNEYCVCYIGPTSRFPIIKLKSVGIDKRCPLLVDHKCSVHKSKPTVCALFPIGRSFVANKGEVLDQSKMDYIFIHPECGNENETHTVREWLTAFGVPIEDKFHFEWTNITTNVSAALRDIEKRKDEETLETLHRIIFMGVYSNYDTSIEFEPQFEANARATRAVVTLVQTGEIPEEYKKTGDGEIA